MHTRTIIALLGLAFGVALLTPETSDAQLFRKWKNKNNNSWSGSYYPNYGYSYSYSNYPYSSSYYGYNYAQPYYQSPPVYSSQSNYYNPANQPSENPQPIAPLSNNSTPREIPEEPIIPPAKPQPEPNTPPVTPPQPPHDTSPPASPMVNITINDGSFSPNNVEVKVGTTVRWTNKGTKAHNVNSAAGTWKSANLNNGETFTYTFTKAGTFSYQCDLHPQMRGTVVVK